MLFCSNVNKWGHRFKGTGCTCTNSKRRLKQIRTNSLSVFVLHPKCSLWHFGPKLTQTQPQGLLWWYWQVTCWVGVLKLGFIPERVKLVVARAVVSPDSLLRTPREPSNMRGGEFTDLFCWYFPVSWDFCSSCACVSVAFFFSEMALWYCNRGWADPEICLDSFESCIKGLVVSRDHVLGLNVAPTSAVCHV